MPRKLLLTIEPVLVVNRSAVAGAVMGAAAELSYALSDARGRECPHSAAGAEAEVNNVRVSPAGGCGDLGIAILNAHWKYSLARTSEGVCIVRAHSIEPEAGASTNAAEAFAACVFRQLVLRRTVTILRERGFAIVERCTDRTGDITLRARLPLQYQLRPTARTAPPEFAISIDTAGTATIHMTSLRGHSRQCVEQTLTDSLCNMPKAIVSARTRSGIHAA